MRKINRGFTIVELLVVIAVIGILTTIAVIGFSRYQSDARDSQRLSKATVIAEALEKYYDQNGEYPGCSALTQSSDLVTSTVLSGVSKTALVTPQADPSTTNSISCQNIATSSADIFSYTGDGSAICATGSACLQWTISYRDEASGGIKTISSRRKSDIATSGDITTLSATAYSFSQINVGWTAVSGAVTYNIQYATNSSFTGASNFLPAATTNSVSVTGLSLGTVYYFRVQPATATTTGNWSNTASATTYSLDTPSGTAIPDPAAPATQLKFSWNAVANATSYTIQYSSSTAVAGGSGDFTTSPTTITTAANPYYITGLSTGTTLSFHVKAVAVGFTSGWSTTASATTQVPAPVCTSSTVNNNTQITAAWGAVTNATSYTLDYATNSGFTGATSITGITGTNRAVTGLANATTYYFRVKAYIGAVFGNTGACPSATTSIDGPTGIGWAGQGDAVRAYAGLPWMPGADPGYGSYWGTVGMSIYGSCSPGATVVTRLYSYYAYSNGSSGNGGTTMEWTYNNQTRYVVDGNPGWYVWWQGWVACQSGSTRVGDTYLGNVGPY